MLKKLFIPILVLLSFSCLCYSAETQPMNPNELLFKTTDGRVITLTRKNYIFFSMIHQPLEIEPIIVNLDTIMLPIVYSQYFANILTVQRVKNDDRVNLKDYVLKDINAENARTDNLACQIDLNSLTELSVNDLQMSNAAKGYIYYGYCDRQKPMKIYAIFGFLQNEDNSTFLRFYGLVSVNPEHPFYNDISEINAYLYDLKVDILTARFE